MWYDMGERKMMVLKIVVLAGGLSTERAVSLVTGVGVCRALRENGHRAVLADLYLGLEDVPEDLESLFDAPDGLCPEVISHCIVKRHPGRLFFRFLPGRSLFLLFLLLSFPFLLLQTPDLFL